jgi:hypothetical protein
MNRIAFSPEFGDPSIQSLSWKQIEEVSIKDTALTIRKEISTGIYQWDRVEVKKSTSQASIQHSTKGSRATPYMVLYPIMNRTMPFEDYVHMMS